MTVEATWSIQSRANQSLVESLTMIAITSGWPSDETVHPDSVETPVSVPVLACTHPRPAPAP